MNAHAKQRSKSPIRNRSSGAVRAAPISILAPIQGAAGGRSELVACLPAPPSCSNRQSFGLLAASAAMPKVTTGVASRQSLTIAAPASTVTLNETGAHPGIGSRAPVVIARSKPASKTRMISSSIAERGDRRAWPVSRVTCRFGAALSRQRSLFSPHACAWRDRASICRPDDEAELDRTMKSREEQLIWAKQRALFCVDMGHFSDAVRAARGEPGARAQDLLTQRGGRSFPIADADSFFVKLHETLEALRQASRPHPLSVEMAIALAKRYWVSQDRLLA